jgi:hypothetical protein
MEPNHRQTGPGATTTLTTSLPMSQHLNASLGINTLRYVLVADQQGVHAAQLNVVSAQCTLARTYDVQANLGATAHATLPMNPGIVACAAGWG